MGGRWILVALAIPTLVAIAALYLAVDNIARAGPSGAPAASPAVPTVISYQGLLTDPGTGQPKADGNYNMRFRIFNDPSAGALLWEEPGSGSPAASVAVVGGVFTMLLGSTVPLDASVFGGGSAYLAVEVNGETLSPRQRIAAVAYAMVAETLDGESLSDLDDRYVNVSGDIMTGATSIAEGSVLRANNTGSAGGGVVGTGPTDGVLGMSVGGTGVHGESVTGFGGFFSSANDHYDLFLGGAVGRINTDPSDENSDLYLSSNNDAIVKLDNDGGESGVLRVKNSGGTDVCTVDESGNLSCAGNGTLKAAFHVVEDAGNISIERWFNNVNGVAPTITTYGPGDYRFDMGFDVSQRYVVCTIDTNAVATRNANCAAGTFWWSPGSTNIDVNTWDPDGGGGYVAAEFNLLVY